MVNKIPSYTISAGGRIAVLSSRSHPGASRVMVPACCEALESSGVASDDIYIMDAPGDLLVPGLCRELSRSGFYAAIVALAVLPGKESLSEAVLNGMTGSDFAIPVIPGMVIGESDPTALAHTAQEAARAAVELTNVAAMILEMQGAAVESFVEDTEGIEAASPIERKRAGRRRGRQLQTVAAAPSRKARTAKAGTAEASTGKRRGRPRKTK